MKMLLLAGVGALALGITTANAADLIRRPPAPVIAPPYSWTGFYIGINGGGGFGRSELSNVFGTTGLDVSGGLVGGTLGYNYQTGPWVFGIEGDGDWSGIKGSTSSGICAGTSCEVRNDWLATLRGRVGYSFGRFMPYVTGGAAFGDIKQSITGFTGSTTDKAGWTAGAGIEAALSGPWTAKLEYLYVDLGSATCSAANCGTTTTADFTSNIVRVGLNYRF
ncbi:MAG: porin family protein [Pseudolabrys sp.]